ncbi:cell division protein ZapE [Saccharospirillum mangrovi]|uniref:cell division protein ZapE n=1 Tax=Saccharospirillum mangrovi TaxID=2161747 RepID=UPI000D3A7178|nr:cell division protein ZapE [Saccharospirillum mangrovi]
MTTPWARYQADLEQPGFSHDPAQEDAVKALQSVFDQLLAQQETQKKLTGRLGRLFGRSPEPVTGLYFWGGVGRGKTYLMDTFFQTLPFEDKGRMHFHHFMRRVHRGLKEHKGQSNPLDLVAEEIARESRVLCFDEFFVTDIGDAMILGNLLRALFERGVTLVATSNIPPDKLYKDGLQRALFIPAIELLKRHTRVLNVDGGVDYRLRTLKQVKIFHSPLDASAERNLQESFRKLAPDARQAIENAQLNILGRRIEAVWLNDDVVLFDFAEICGGPRSQNDYIEIAQQFHAVLIRNVPLFDGKNDDMARRFINLVDEFYDRKVKLLLTAADTVQALYRGGRLSFEFQRTVSRLLEMQSEDYLQTVHKA